LVRALGTLTRLGLSIGQILGRLLPGLQPVVMPEDILRCVASPNPQACERRSSGLTQAGLGLGGDWLDDLIDNEIAPNELPGRK
jgi:hypothetical protein